MNYTVVLDWRFVVALGVAATGVIFAMSMTSADAKEVMIHAIDTCKEYAVATNDC